MGLRSKVVLAPLLFYFAILALLEPSTSTSEKYRISLYMKPN